MRLRLALLAALALSLALPASAAERRDRQQLRAPSQVELMRADVMLRAELARPVLGDQAVELIQDRARHAQRLEQLEAIANDGRRAFDAVLDFGADAAQLIIHSPSGVLVGRETEDPRIEGVGRPRWTRGSWMDSPDGAS